MSAIDFFPYPSFRKGQKEIIEQIEKYLDPAFRRPIILEASNGFGKTLTVLSAVLPYIMEYDYKVIYCCRTHTQMSRVLEELKFIQKTKELPKKITAVSLRARNQVCLLPEVRSIKSSIDGMALCKNLKRFRKCKFYNKMLENKAEIHALLVDMSGKTYETQEVVDICYDRNFCPYEFIKIFLRVSDVIVCHYLWLFHPDIKKNFLDALNEDLGNFILIIDEAHNLPHIATEIDSMSLSYGPINQALKEISRIKEENIKKDTIKQFLKYTHDLIDGLTERNAQTSAVDPNEILTKIKKQIGNIDLLNFFTFMEKIGEAYEKAIMKNDIISKSALILIAQFWQKWFLTANKSDYFHQIQIKRVNRVKSIQTFTQF